MYCKNCGNQIEDNAVFCPHCGTDTGNASAVVQKKVNVVAIAAFVISLLSIWLGIYFCIASIVGLVLSIVGITLRKKYKHCNGFAIAGVVISVLSLLFWGLYWACVAGLSLIMPLIYLAWGGWRL